MSDTPLLRLARLMLRFVGNESSNDPDSLNLHAALFDLVRDLEAAPPPETGLEPRGCPTPGACPCPVARRTITREELGAAVRILRNLDTKFEEDVMTIAAAWRLTVEDA